MSAADTAWLEAHCLGAPAELHRRVDRYFGMTSEGLALPDRLGEAGLLALRATLGSAGDRSSALDLLAADALVTASLQAGAEQDPAGLAALAVRLLRSGVGLA